MGKNVGVSLGGAGNLLQWKLPGICGVTPAETSSNGDMKPDPAISSVLWRDQDTISATKPLTYNLSACKMFWGKCGAEIMEVANHG